MRASLKVTIGFGLASIPVGLAKLVDDDDSVEFRSLHSVCSTPLKELKMCPSCDVVVPPEDLIKGFEVAKADFLLFTVEEVLAAKPVSDGIVRLAKFAPLDQLPEPHMWLRHYIVLPDETFPDRYAALLDALVVTESMGVGESVLWKKRRAVVLRPAPDGQHMLLSTVTQASPRIRDFSPVVPDETTFKLAVDLVNSMHSELKPSDLNSVDSVRVLVESKLGMKSKRPAELKPSAVGQDFQAQLKASLGKKAKVRR